MLVRASIITPGGRPTVLRLNRPRARPTEPTSLGEDEVFLHLPETTGPSVMTEAMAPGKGAGLSLPASASTASKL